MTDLIIVGAGNADIIRLIEDINKEKKQYNILGFLEKNKDYHGKKILGYSVLGDDDLLISKYSHCAVINNIMQTPQLHEKVAFQLKNKYGIKNFPSLVHPSVNVKYVSLDEGNIIYENVSLATGVTLGKFNIIYSGTCIGHEAEIEDFNLFALNITIGARTTIGSRNLFGNNSTMSLGLKIIDDNIIGVNTVLIENVKSSKSLLGYPAEDSLVFLYKYKKKIIKNRKNG